MRERCGPVVAAARRPGDNKPNASSRMTATQWSRSNSRSSWSADGRPLDLLSAPTLTRQQTGRGNLGHQNLTS